MGSEKVVGGKQVTLCAVGDVLINHDDLACGFALLAPVLGAADLVFGNCEGVYAERARGLMGGKPFHADGLQAGCMSVMAGANNHFIGSGEEIMLQTMEELRQRGIEVVGAGRNLEEARRPVIVERNGLKIAFLAYVSTFYAGDEARSKKPGVNPLRFHNHYYTLEGDLDYNPGIPPAVMTIAYQRDMAAMKSAIAKAKASADVVVISYHWGEAMRPFIIRDYERQTARVAIDAGADLILCHHPHVVRGIDFYHGKPIFHGLGNSVLHVRGGGGDIPPEVKEVLVAQSGEYAPQVYPDYPLLPMHPDSRISMVAVCTFQDGQVIPGLVPAYILPSGQVEPLDPNSKRGQEVVEYYRLSTRESGLHSEIVAGDATLGGFPVLRIRPTGLEAVTRQSRTALVADE